MKCPCAYPRQLFSWGSGSHLLSPSHRFLSARYSFLLLHLPFLSLLYEVCYDWVSWKYLPRCIAISTYRPISLFSFAITTLDWMVNRWETRNSISILLLSCSNQASIPSTSGNCPCQVHGWPPACRIHWLHFYLSNWLLCGLIIPSLLTSLFLWLAKSPFLLAFLLPQWFLLSLVCWYLLGATSKCWDSPELSCIYSYSPLQLFHLVLRF